METIAVTPQASQEHESPLFQPQPPPDVSDFAVFCSARTDGTSAALGRCGGELKDNSAQSGGREQGRPMRLAGGPLPGGSGSRTNGEKGGGCGMPRDVRQVERRAAFILSEPNL